MSFHQLIIVPAVGVNEVINDDKVGKDEAGIIERLICYVLQASDELPLHLQTHL